MGKLIKLKQHPEYIVKAVLTEMVEIVLGRLLLKYLTKILCISSIGISVSGVAGIYKDRWERLQQPIMTLSLGTSGYRK